MRIGSGVDVHAFAEGIPLWLGGIHIPHTHGLAGHSDGDAAVHALIDALLGAAGRGDIGEWFPSTEERWRGVRSTEMLRHVWSALHADGWRIENADLTLVASRAAAGAVPLPDAPGPGRCAGRRPDAGLAQSHDDGRPGRVGRAEGVMAMAAALLWRADE